MNAARLTGAMLTLASCAGAGHEQSTTVRVRVSVQDSPETVVIEQPAPLVIVRPTPMIVAAQPPARRPPPPSPPSPTCGFERDPEARAASFGEVSLGHGHTCTRISDGTVRCWGWNLDGETGNGSTGSDHGPAAPAEVRDVEGATQVCVGFSYSCARLRDGTAECWGNNTHNQIRFSLAASCTPHPVRSPVDHIRSLACGGWHVCALRNDGRVWCWGEDAPRYSPWQVRLPGRAVEVSAGWRRTCARMENNAVHCWTVTSRDPVLVSGFPSAPTQLSVAERYACAVLADHRVACWGEGYHGELGNGAALEAASPVVVEGISSAREVSVHQGRACALTDDGAIWCWGEGEPSRGRGRVQEASIVGPTRVTSVGPSEHLYVGEHHACAHTRVGALCCWGDNSYGQLGNNEARPPRAGDGPTAVVW